MLPNTRAIMVCSPTAIDLFSIWTLLRVAEVLGREIRKVRNMLGGKCKQTARNECDIYFT